MNKDQISDSIIKSQYIVIEKYAWGMQKHKEYKKLPAEAGWTGKKMDVTIEKG